MTKKKKNSKTHPYNEIYKITIGIYESPKYDVTHSLIHGVSGRWLAEPVIIVVALCMF